jgi:hypothetical protein
MFAVTPSGIDAALVRRSDQLVVKAVKRAHGGFLQGIDVAGMRRGSGDEGLDLHVHFRHRVIISPLDSRWDALSAEIATACHVPAPSASPPA